MIERVLVGGVHPREGQEKKKNWVWSWKKKWK